MEWYIATGSDFLNLLFWDLVFRVSATAVASTELGNECVRACGWRWRMAWLINNKGAWHDRSTVGWRGGTGEISEEALTMPHTHVYIFSTSGGCNGGRERKHTINATITTKPLSILPSPFMLQLLPLPSILPPRLEVGVMRQNPISQLSTHIFCACFTTKYKNTRDVN
jgi:hypothetical protein